MKTITINRKGYGFVEVPDIVDEIRIWSISSLLSVKTTAEKVLAYHADDPFYTARFAAQHPFINTLLPPGDYSIIGLSNQLTEEQCAGIVEGSNVSWENIIYRNYSDDGGPFELNAKDSLNSLLHSLNLDPDKVYAVLLVNTPTVLRE